ncbi:unnamed protein product, partial [Closterium sp. NIES-54]
SKACHCPLCPAPSPPPTHTPHLHLNAPLLPSLQCTPSTPPPVFLPLPTPTLPPTSLRAVHTLPVAFRPSPVSGVGTTPASLPPCPPSAPPVPPRHQTVSPIGSQPLHPLHLPPVPSTPLPRPTPVTPSLNIFRLHSPLGAASPLLSPIFVSPTPSVFCAPAPHFLFLVPQRLLQVPSLSSHFHTTCPSTPSSPTTRLTPARPLTPSPTTLRPSPSALPLSLPPGPYLPTLTSH